MLNIKASFIAASNLLDEKPSEVFHRFKEGDVKFTIYRHKLNLLNVTGIKSSNELLRYKAMMQKRFNQELKVKIDCIFFSKKDTKIVDLMAMHTYLRENSEYFVNYNVELFPGMFLQPWDKKLPTILVFRTGSYTIMGGKSMEGIVKSEVFVKKLISLHEKIKV